MRGSISPSSGAKAVAFATGGEVPRFRLRHRRQRARPRASGSSWGNQRAGRASVRHTSNPFRIKDGERLAERLCGLSFAEKVFFANSGAEAIECAIKTARRYQTMSTASRIGSGSSPSTTLPRPHLGLARHREEQEPHEGFGPMVGGFTTSRSATSRRSSGRSGRTRPASWSSRCRARAAFPAPDGHLEELRLGDAHGALLP